MRCVWRRHSDVRLATAEDNADIAANPVDAEAQLAAIGAKGGFGEEGFSTTARTCGSTAPLPRDWRVGGGMGGVGGEGGGWGRKCCTQ